MKNCKHIIILTAVSLALTACQNMKGRDFIASLFSDHEPEQVEQSTDPNGQTSGYTFNDISVPDFDRNPISVLEEARKHKITILDFWASWCGPCMNEMPNIVDIYNSYKDKGLGIIGLSLDSDYKRWKEATQANNMTWLQLSELRGWDSEVAKVNGVQAIPHTIIIDKSGNILATDLRGEDLKQFVAEALKK